MKILSFILSLFFLGLNLVPLDCMDAEESQQHQSEISSQTQGDHKGDTELCPPFCSCQCCHVHVAEFNFQNSQIPIQEIPSREFIYRSPKLQDVFTPFFQPPKS